MRLSYIVPVHNSASHLGKTVSLTLVQTSIIVAAVLGAIIGAIAGGGKGAAIGAGVGAAGGGVYQGATGGKQVKIPSETKLDFQLEQPVTVTVMPRPAPPQ